MFSTIIMMIIGLAFSLKMPFSDILRVCIFHILLKFTGLFLHSAGPHPSNIQVIGCIMVLAALGHTLLNYFLLKERMNEFSWIGTILGIIGALSIWIGTGERSLIKFN